ncbi:hypothetical protein IJ596_03740 [bacterium]|nr:hypothetical protein [bacterium]
MEHIISTLQQIFMGKEDNSIRIGLSGFKTEIKTMPKKSCAKPKELRLSELMRKEGC